VILRRWDDPERGSGMLSLTWLLAMTGALLLIFSGITFALHSYATSLALGAAQAGARAAAAYPASEERGRQAAQTFLSNKAAAELKGGAVTVRLGPDNLVTVTVTGTSQSLVPGMTLTVTEQAAVAAEVLQ
jgi:hypothetical protein